MVRTGFAAFCAVACVGLAAPAQSETANAASWSLHEFYPSNADDASRRYLNAVVLSSDDSDLEGALIFYCMAGLNGQVQVEFQFRNTPEIDLSRSAFAIADNGFHTMASELSKNSTNFNAYLESENIQFDAPADSSGWTNFWILTNEPFALDYFKQAKFLSFSFVPTARIYGRVKAIAEEASTPEEGEIAIARGLDPYLQGKSFNFSARGSSAAISKVQETCG